MVFSFLAGYLLASNTIDFILLLKLFAGGVALVGASNGLNQVYEIEIDGRMERTKDRPLPTKRISVASALIFSLILGFIGVFSLY